jgi:nitrite reductase/ring-hydroxylating ferredoxin subunit
MSEDHDLDGLGLTRRQALAAAAALCGFGAVAAAGTGVAQASGSLRVKLSAFPALARVGGVANVGSLNGIPVAVVRTGPKRYVALDRRCPHVGVPVTARGTGFICLPPGHGSQFTANGARISGPAPTGLRKLKIRLRNGTLTITA